MHESEQVVRERRVAVAQRAQLIDSAGVTYLAMLVDVSIGGFRVECHQLLRVGEYIVIQSGRKHPQRGQIRWADGHTRAGSS